MPTLACRQIIVFFLVSMAVSTANPVFAGSTSVTNGKSVRVNLGFRIEIPPMLVLQVKTLTVDNSLTSHIFIDKNDVNRSNTNGRKVSITASTNVPKYSVLSAPSDLLSFKNSPFSMKWTEHGHIEAFTLPYNTTGRHPLTYPPMDPATVSIPANSPNLILCSP